MKKIKTEKFVPYWTESRNISAEYFRNISLLEKKMRKDLGNDELEFFWCDGEIAGIGTTDREMELIHDTELDRLARDEKIKTRQ